MVTNLSMPTRAILLCILIFLSMTLPLRAEEEGAKEEAGSIFTFWPLIDYRESPREKFSSLSILGPLVKIRNSGDSADIAIRPFFYRSGSQSDGTASTEYLYPLASSETWREGSFFQVLKLYQKRSERTDGDVDKRTMLFPFYISGRSEKYGRYVSVFPFYGDIYERFWRDEYHYVLFPFYGRTVKNGTETSNYLYPFFSVTRGENESGFQFWPLYGQSEKEGVFRKRFAMWPVYFLEESGLDTAAPARRFYLFPFYTSAESVMRSERHYLWPFFGYVSDRGKGEEERDYFWPFVVTIRGETRNLDRYLPFFSEDRRKNSLKRWYMWPLYSHEESNCESFRQERDRVLFFLYSDNREIWTIDDRQRRRLAVWPFLTYRNDERGVKTFTFPAPVEPVLNKEGIERSWAPLWRIYIQKWNDAGDSAVSFLWNLYWHEKRNKDLAYEFFPFVFYRSEKQGTEFSLIKGLVRYRETGTKKKLNFLWLPFGIEWGKPAASGEKGGPVEMRSTP
jgi:hypothetical protein